MSVQTALHSDTVVVDLGQGFHSSWLDISTCEATALVSPVPRHEGRHVLRICSGRSDATICLNISQVESLQAVLSAYLQDCNVAISDQPNEKGEVCT